MKSKKSWGRASPTHTTHGALRCYDMAAGHEGLLQYTEGMGNENGETEWVATNSPLPEFGHFQLFLIGPVTAPVIRLCLGLGRGVE